MQISAYGRQKLIQREGKRNFAYPDPASPLAKKARSTQWGYRPAREILKNFPESVQQLSGAPWTCGIGITGKEVTIDTHWNDKIVDQKFKAHLVSFTNEVEPLITPNTAQNEFDAILSLVFNIGVSNFVTSTVRRCHNKGDKAGAARAFHLFNKAQGSVNAGLVNRRADESAQYTTPYSDGVSVPNQTSAQDVEPERSLAKSEINVASTATAVTAGTTAVASLLDAIDGKEVAIAMMVVVAIAVFIVYQRYKQRKGGWA